MRSSCRFCFCSGTLQCLMLVCSSRDRLCTLKANLPLPGQVFGNSDSRGKRIDITVDCEATRKSLTCDKFYVRDRDRRFGSFMMMCSLVAVFRSRRRPALRLRYVSFAVRIGPSVVGDVLAAVVSLCQTCPFGNNRYKMLVQKVYAKKNPSKLSDLLHL